MGPRDVLIWWTMYPVLFKVGPVAIGTYGVMIGLGFLAGLWVLTRLAGRSGLKPKKLIDLTIFIALGAIIGARLGHVLENLGRYSTRPLQAFNLWDGGVHFYGGLIGGVLVGFVVIRWIFRLPLWRVLDCYAPAMALGSAFGRVGCFLAGCCFGVPTKVPWAVKFGSTSALAGIRPDLVGKAVHPTQVYYAIGLLIIFALVMWLWRRRRFDGQVFWVYGLCHAILRLGIEPLRDDKSFGPVLFGMLTETQALSIGLGALAMVMLWALRRRARDSNTVN